MHRMGHGKQKGGDGRFKRLTVSVEHLIRPLYGANRGGQHRAATVLVGFVWQDGRLLADYTCATHFLLKSIAVRNDPVAADQLHRRIALIVDADVIGENVLFGLWIRLMFEILSLDPDSDGLCANLDPTILLWM